MKYVVTDEDVERVIAQVKRETNIDGMDGDSWDRILARAALESFAQTLGEPVAVPDGYVLVPVEPTVEMMRAADKLPENFSIGDEWKAMLSAAPHHPTREKGCE